MLQFPSLLPIAQMLILPFAAFGILLSTFANALKAKIEPLCRVYHVLSFCPNLPEHQDKHCLSSVQLHLLFFPKTWQTFPCYPSQLPLLPHKTISCKQITFIVLNYMQPASKNKDPKMIPRESLVIYPFPKTLNRIHQRSHFRRAVT